MKKFIAVAGNIGVGKSTLVSMICDRLTCKPYYEPVTENPYLADFYKDMISWSFHSQIFFLTHRLRMHQELIRNSGSVIQDRSIYEDAVIFAQNLYLQGRMSERDHKTYHALYQTLAEYLPLRICSSIYERLSPHFKNALLCVIVIMNKRSIRIIYPP